MSFGRRTTVEQIRRDLTLRLMTVAMRVHEHEFLTICALTTSANGNCPDCEARGA